MSTQRDRLAAKREQKLREIDEAIACGSLVIRRMTSAERTRYPAKERPPQRSRAFRR